MVPISRLGLGELQKVLKRMLEARTLLRKAILDVARIGRRHRIPSPWSGCALLRVAGNRWPFRLCGVAVPV